MGLVRVGRGKPLTLFAPGEFPDHEQSLAQLRQAAAEVRGTRLLFSYERSGHFHKVPPLRRQAERDAAEVLAVAAHTGASQAFGISRGARAMLGALAEDPEVFEKVVLALPPGGNAVGYFREWLAGLTPGQFVAGVDILILGMRGDSYHPANVAEAWAERLGAQLHVFDKRGDPPGVENLRRRATEFLNA